MSENTELSSQGDSPAPPDEGWWEAVMRDGDHSSARSSNHSGPEHDDWKWVTDLFQNDLPVDLEVTGFNRGGLLIQARHLRGFVPVSHVLDYDPNLGNDERERTLASKVESTLRLKVIELDVGRGRLVFSERAALADAGERNRILDQLHPGDCVWGTVTNITPFGVFVDLGGLEGLVHVSELSWGRVRHPEDVVCCGQEMRVKVVTVNQELGRVALSLKDLQPDPWEALDGKYHEGDIVDGVVTNSVPFGAFVRLEEGLEGLIHISELNSSQVLLEGEPVRARIIRIDAARRRLGLSLKEIPPIE